MSESGPAGRLQHAVPESKIPVELGVEITVRQQSLEARISAFGAASPGVLDGEAARPDGEAESGRGLALIRALVTRVPFTRQDGTNTWTLAKTPLHA